MQCDNLAEDLIKNVFHISHSLVLDETNYCRTTVRFRWLHQSTRVMKNSVWVRAIIWAQNEQVKKNCFLSLHYQTHLNKHKRQQKSLGTSFTSLRTFLWQVLCISFHHLSRLLFHWNFCHLNNGVKHQITCNLYRWQFVAFWCYHTNVNHLDFTFEIQFGSKMYGSWEEEYFHFSVGRMQRNNSFVQLFYANERWLENFCFFNFNQM